MSKEKTVEIVCVLDRSGSMNSIKSDAIGGFNNFINEQKKVEGNANVSLVLFDDQYEMVYRSKPIETVDDLDDTTFVPRGMTAMYDAIGRTLEDFIAEQKKLKKEKRNPVVFAILTDGEENASKEFQNLKVKEMIEKQQKKGWEFVFLAANQDAFQAGGNLGIDAGTTFNFVANAAGTKCAYASMANSVTTYRNNQK